MAENGGHKVIETALQDKGTGPKSKKRWAQKVKASPEGDAFLT
jgi:hypothetical protein